MPPYPIWLTPYCIDSLIYDSFIYYGHDSRCLLAAVNLSQISQGSVHRQLPLWVQAYWPVLPISTHTKMKCSCFFKFWFHHPLRLLLLFQFNSIFLHTFLFLHSPPTHTLLAKLSPRLLPPVISHPLSSLLHLSDTNDSSLSWQAAA